MLIVALPDSKSIFRRSAQYIPGSPRYFRLKHVNIPPLTPLNILFCRNLKNTRAEKTEQYINGIRGVNSHHEINRKEKHYDLSSIQVY